MKKILMVMCCAVFFVGCASHSNSAKALASRVENALPNGWSITNIQESTTPGKEGIYIFLKNPAIKLKRSYSPDFNHAFFDIYFRPKSAKTECIYFTDKHSLYQQCIGETEEYDVYGGSTEPQNDGILIKALGLE